jgi:glutamate formiminotransferase
MVIGARPFLIAYNVNLATNDLHVAKEIARDVREKGDGLRSVKALGFELKDKNQVQVSMNLTVFQIIGMLEAFNFVRAEAAKREDQIAESELIGPVPKEALTEALCDLLSLKGFGPKQIVEIQQAAQDGN